MIDLYLQVPLALVGKFGSSGSMAIMFVYTAELFPTSVRNTAIGVSSMWGRVGGMLAPQVRHIYPCHIIYIGFPGLPSVPCLPSSPYDSDGCCVSGRRSDDIPDPTRDTGDQPAKDHAGGNTDRTGQTG